MRKLIKLQLRNIFHSKLIYICTTLIILLNPVATLVVSNSFSDIIKNTNICGEILSILSVGIIETVFIVLVSCSDFNDGTTKNIIARGYTRNQLLFSKYIAILISLLFMHLAGILSAIILLFKNSFGYNTTILYQIINSVVSIIAYTIFYTTMSFLLEKNGSGIIACMFVPNLIPTALTLLNKIVPFNITKLWMEHGEEIFTEKPSLSTLGLSALYYVIYFIIFIIIGTQLLKRKEIK